MYFNKLNKEIKNKIDEKLLGSTKENHLGAFVETFQEMYLMNEFQSELVENINEKSIRNCTKIFIDNDEEFDLFAFKEMVFFNNQDDKKIAKEIKNEITNNYVEREIFNDIFSGEKLSSFFRGGLSKIVFNFCLLNDRPSFNFKTFSNTISQKIKSKFKEIFKKEINVEFNIYFLEDLVNKMMIYSDQEGVFGTVSVPILKVSQTNKGSILIFDSPNENDKIKTYIGVIDCKGLKKIYKDLESNGELNTLFSLNVREYFRDNKVDTKISKTLKESPSNFFAFNNGLTIIGENIFDDGTNIKIDNMCIINGAQTTNIICNTDFSENENPGVMAKIIDISEILDKDKRMRLMSEFVQASNNQKPVKIQDLMSQQEEVKIFIRQFNEISHELETKLWIQPKKGSKYSGTSDKKTKSVWNLETLLKNILTYMLFQPGTSKSGFSQFINADQQKEFLKINSILKTLKKPDIIKQSILFINSALEIKTAVSKFSKVYKNKLKDKITKLDENISNPNISEQYKNNYEKQRNEFRKKMDFFNTGILYMESIISLILSTDILNESFINDLIILLGKNKEIDLLEFMISNNMMKKTLPFSKTRFMSTVNEVETLMESLIPIIMESINDEQKNNATSTIANITKTNKVFKNVVIAISMKDDKIFQKSIENFKNTIALEIEKEQLEKL